jgi:PAS domain S-box-containing protein
MEIKEALYTLKLLVIEDNPGDQLIIKELLMDSSFIIKNSSRLDDSLLLIEKEKFDAVILDLGLPDSDGINSLNSIKAFNSSLPIIVLTVDDSDQTGLMAIRNGAQDFITKHDLKPALLRKSIRYAISRKKLELELRESLAMNESIFDQAAVGLAHLSIELLFIKVNQKFCEIVGYEKNELLGKSLSLIAFPEDLEKDLTNIKALVSGKEKSYKIEKRFYHKNGSIVWTNLTRTAILDTSNKIICFFTTYEDITAKKLLEFELQRQNKLLDTVIGILPVGIWITDAFGKLISNNKKSEEIWVGSKYDDFGNMKEINGWWAHNGKRLSNEEWGLYRAITKKETSIGEIINIQCLDGTKKTILNSAVPILHNDEVIVAVAVNADITQIIETEKMLKILVKEKEMLIKEAHHRIKNNLQLVSSLIKLSQLNLNDTEAKAVLTSTLNRIMSISNLHEHLYRSEKENEIGIQSYMNTIVDHIKVGLLADTHEIKIEQKIEDFIISSRLAISLGLIVNELITNSVKHAFDNRNAAIYIDIKQQDGGIILIFKDNGTGLPEKIDFENTETLGFQIIHSRVLQHNGYIENKNDEGAEFKIFLEK